MSKRILVFLLLIAPLLLSACGAPELDVPVQDGGGPAGDGLVRGQAFVADAQVLVMESFPIQVMLVVRGELPTPCHSLQAEVAAPDDQNRILVEVFSAADPNEVCIQMLEPFEERVSIPLEGAADGDYTILVNGEEVGGFSYQGG